MKLATARTATGTTVVRIDDDVAVDVDATDVGTLLRDPDWRAVAGAARGQGRDVAGLDLAPVVPRPGKIVCVGLNYREHIVEMGRELPQHPTLFAKFHEALVGPRDDIVLPRGSRALDWEAELAVVVGQGGRRLDVAAAHRAIAGFAVLNDVTERDLQYRTTQWLQGKTLESSTPLGPWLVTTDEVDPDAEIVCEVDGEVVQRSRTGDLVFGPADLVSYVSQIVTLSPGDVIATGTPGGVGHARTPARYLDEGAVLVTRIEGVGELRNTVVADRTEG